MTPTPIWNERTARALSAKININQSLCGICIAAWPFEPTVHVAHLVAWPGWKW
jgi:hypothetical protein